MQTEEGKQKGISLKKEKKIKKISTIIMIIIIVIGILATTDIILVTKANIGPFFAIRTKVYNDGGTKEYYGLFYKVLKYNQQVGRRDTVLGTYSLKYNTTPTNYTIEELSYALNNNDNNYTGAFIRLTGTIAKIDPADKILIITYQDNEEGKYDLTIEAELLSNNLKDLKTGAPVNLLGTLKNYDLTAKKATISNAFAE